MPILDAALGQPARTQSPHALKHVYEVEEGNYHLRLTGLVLHSMLHDLRRRFEHIGSQAIEAAETGGHPVINIATGSGSSTMSLNDHPWPRFGPSEKYAHSIWVR